MSNPTLGMNGKVFQEQLKVAEVLLRNLPEKVSDAASKRALDIHGELFRRTFIRSRLSGGDGLRRRTGNLARSISHFVKPDTGKTSLFVWIDKSASYWITHEEGRTIRPKGHPYLAIPVGKALHPSGAPKWKSPLDVVFGDGEGLRFMQKKGGKPFLGRVNWNGKVEVYFLLREEVTIKPRLKMVELWRGMVGLVIPTLERELVAGLDKYSKGTNK